MSPRGLFVALAVVAGAASALQGATNAGLTGRIGVASAVLVNAVVLLTGTLVFWAWRGAPLTFFPAGTPWNLYLGGLLGFTIITTIALAFPRLGGATTIALMVLGQGLMTLAIDHFGLLGMPRDPLTLGRLLGILAVAAGVFLIRR